jgi:hypothetical protein
MGEGNAEVDQVTEVTQEMKCEGEPKLEKDVEMTETYRVMHNNLGRYLLSEFKKMWI